MARKTSSYAFQNVAATVDGLAVQGGWDGDDAVVVTHGADIGGLLVGADGSSIFSQSSDHSATISLKLQHTSPTHRQLMQKLQQQRAGRLIGFPVDVKDTGSGEGGTADQCYIVTAPVDSKGKMATVREWMLVTGDWNPEIPNG